MTKTKFLEMISPHVWLHLQEVPTCFHCCSTASFRISVDNRTSTSLDHHSKVTGRTLRRQSKKKFKVYIIVRQMVHFILETA